MLLVLDNCRHLFEPAAALAVRIRRAAPGVQILVSGREPLRAAGEHVHRPPPLKSPPPAAGLTAAASAEVAGAEVVECVANLVTKSLIAADVGGPVPCYRLLRTTEADAFKKLVDARELEPVQPRRVE